jgi:hypothetical protein
LLDRTVGALGGRAHAVFDATPSNPTERAVRAAAEVYRDEGCDGLVAIGGGSSIDLAKGVAIAATHPGPLTTYATIEGGSPRISERVAPLIAIPTTAGTGSEVTRFTVVTDTETDEKMLIAGLACCPTAAIVDYELTLTMPLRLTADTGIDSLTHAIEAYVSRRANPYSDGMARNAMGLRRWQPRRPGIWNPAETISVDLMGLRKEAVAVLGQARHVDVVAGMASVFEEWISKWLEHAMPAAWFAHFLLTESGRVLIPAGITRLATIVTTFEDRDWHQLDLGALFTQVLAICWAHFRKDVEAQQELRRAFLDVLTRLCATQVPEALHLRNRVSATLGAA